MDALSEWTDIVAVAGTVGTFVFGVLSVILYRKGSIVKRLLYRTIVNTPVLTEESSEYQEINVIVNGVGLREPTVYVLRIENTGNVATRTGDFEKPIGIRFHRASSDSAQAHFQTNFIEPILIKTSPSNESIEIHTKSRDTGHIDEVPGLTVKPFLLNTNEYFDLHLLAEGQIGRLDFDYRISDLAKIENEETQKRRRARSQVGSSLLLADTAAGVSLLWLYAIGPALFSSRERAIELGWPLFLVFSVVALRSFVDSIDRYLKT